VRSLPLDVVTLGLGQRAGGLDAHGGSVAVRERPPPRGGEPVGQLSCEERAVQRARRERSVRDLAGLADAGDLACRQSHIDVGAGGGGGAAGLAGSGAIASITCTGSACGGGAGTEAGDAAWAAGGVAVAADPAARIIE
jgi:hypothetical protein